MAELCGKYQYPDSQGCPICKQELTPEEMVQEVKNTLAMVRNELCFGGNWEGAKARIDRCEAQLAKSQVCPECNGNGFLIIGAGDHEATDKCPTCQGTGKEPKVIPCEFEDWDDTTLPHPVCHCLKREGVDCANVPDDVAQCPDYKAKKLARPDREKIETVLKHLFFEYKVKVGLPLGLESPDREMYVLPLWADQIIDLIPDIEDLKNKWTFELGEIALQETNKEVEKAKEQERERVRGIINDLNSIGYPYGADYKAAILQALIPGVHQA